MAAKKPPAADNEKKLEALHAELKGFFDGAGKLIKDLRVDNASLEKAVAEKDAQIESDRQANESLGKKILSYTKEVGEMGKKLLGVVAAFVVAGAVVASFLFARHYYGGAGEQVAVNKPAAGAAASKSLRDEDTRTIAESNRVDGEKRGQAILAQQKQIEAIAAKLKSMSSPSTATNSIVSVENWKVLDVAYRSKIFQDACPKVDWTEVDSERYEAGLARVSQEEAKTIVSTCNVEAIVAKAPADTVEANNDVNGPEDEAAREGAAAPSPVAPGLIHKASYWPPAPSPWGYRRPYGRYGHGRPYCEDGGTLVDADTAHPKCEHHVTDRAQLDSVAGHHRFLDPSCHEYGQVVHHVIKYHGRWAVGDFTCH